MSARNSVLRRVRDIHPSRVNHLITLRGFLLLAFIMFLLTGPVPHDADIIATVMAYSLLVIVSLIVLYSLIRGNYLKRSLKVTLHPPKIESGGGYHAEKGIAALEDSKFIIGLPRPTLLPFFVLSIELEFECEGVRPVIHQITNSVRRLKRGRDGKKLRLEEHLEFPHRGVWNCSGVRLEFGDQFGFSKFRWHQRLVESSSAVLVHPCRMGYAQFPVLSSSHRAGDTVLDVKERAGDYYDLKPYHPSDGIKKISWKIFAKTGELISRHPERSMTPEGQIVIYLLADKNDDIVCREVMRYVAELEELEIEIFFGCEGMGDQEVARDAESCEELVINSVWATEESSFDSISGEVHYLLDRSRKFLHGAKIDRLVIFCSRTRLRSEETLQQVVELGSALEANGILPVFCLSTAEHSTPSGAPLASYIKGPEPRSGVSQLIGQLLVETPVVQQSADPEIYRRFLDICLNKSWQAIIPGDAA